jgi:predicted nucleic acid-binding protein
MAQYIFDTNIFNRILDGNIDPIFISNKVKLRATHVEIDELKATSNKERRQKLLKVFEAIAPVQVSTESAVWGVSKWGKAKWTKEDNLYQLILDALNTANGGRKSNIQDALIAETAIFNKLTLVTEDIDLSEVAKKYGCEVISLEIFLQQIA